LLQQPHNIVTISKPAMIVDVTATQHHHNQQTGNDHCCKSHTTPSTSLSVGICLPEIVSVLLMTTVPSDQGDQVPDSNISNML